mgnify:CR=1 FL=1
MSSFLLKFLPILALACILFSSCKSPQPEAGTKTETETPSLSKDDQQIWFKLESIHLKNVEFTKDTTFNQAINILKLRARELDTTPYTKPQNPPQQQDLSQFSHIHFGALKFKNVSLAEALNQICKGSKLTWEVKHGAIWFNKTPETEPAPELPDHNKILLIRLHAYQLGHLEFTEDISFQQAIDMLRLRYRDVDWATTKPVKSLTSRSKQDYAKFGNRKPGALVIKRMSMAEALDLICGRCGLKWKIEDGGVVFSEST